MNPIVVEFISTENIRTFIECPEIVILKQRGIDMFFNTYGENMTLITIKDSVYTIMECFYFLKEVLLCNENNASTEQENALEIYKLSFNLQSSVVSRLIGTHGAAIEPLRKIAHCGIMFKKVGDESNEMTLVEITGEGVNIPQTFTLLMMRIVAYDPRTGCMQSNADIISAVNKSFEKSTLTDSKTYSKYLLNSVNPNIVGNSEVVSAHRLRDMREGQAVLTFTTTDKHAGALIGKGGERMKDVRERTKTVAIVHKAGDNQTSRTVEVSGELSGVTAAAEMFINFMKA